MLLPHCKRPLFLETFNRIREKLSCTEMKCAWTLPSYAKDASFAEVKDINFKSAKKLKQELDRTLENLNPSCASEPLQFTVKTDKKTPTTPSPDQNSMNFLLDLIFVKINQLSLASFIPIHNHLYLKAVTYDQLQTCLIRHNLTWNTTNC